MISAVDVFSTERRKRNQVVTGIRRAAEMGTSAKSRTIMPNPPACRRRSVVFRACSKNGLSAVDFRLSARGDSVSFLENTKLFTGRTLNAERRVLLFTSPDDPMTRSLDVFPHRTHSS